MLKVYFAEISIEGWEYLPQKGPFVLAPKHYSRWDPVIMGLLAREPLYFMTNADQFWGIQGLLIKRLGAFPVQIDRPSLTSLRNAIEVLTGGKSLVLFPEGGIVRDRPVDPLKPGLARIVLQAESIKSVTIPIIPIAIVYQPGVSFRAKVRIRLCPPLNSQIYRQATDKQTAQALTGALERAILDGLEAIKQNLTKSG